MGKRLTAGILYILYIIFNQKCNIELQYIVVFLMHFAYTQNQTKTGTFRICAFFQDREHVFLLKDDDENNKRPSFQNMK